MKIKMAANSTKDLIIPGKIYQYFYMKMHVPQQSQKTYSIYIFKNNKFC